MGSFIDSFEGEPNLSYASQSFVRSSNSDSGGERYIPKPHYSPQFQHETRRKSPVRSCSPQSRKKAIDELKEELSKRPNPKPVRSSSNDYEHSSRKPYREYDSYNSRDNYDSPASSTNLFITNINPITTEDELYDVFSPFGPLASIKILRPFSEEERSRKTLRGFVAYLNRKSAERALQQVRGVFIHNCELSVVWGKPVRLPQRAMEPPRIRHFSSSNRTKIYTPSNRRIDDIIIQLADFVAKEGYHFEDLVREKESRNSDFDFLFNKDSPEHLYYKWRVYSFKQGDTIDEWNTAPFQFISGGETFLPPLPRRETDRERRKSTEFDKIPKSESLSKEQREQVDDLLTSITASRSDILMGMGYFMRLADHADILCDMVADSVSQPLEQVPLSRKIAILYLISDILHNSTAVPKASAFRNLFQGYLLSIFEYLSEGVKEISGRISAKNARDRVLKVIRVWEGWALYPTPFLRELESIVDPTKLESSPPRQGHGAPPPSGDKEDLLAQLRENHRRALEREAKEKLEKDKPPIQSKDNIEIGVPLDDVDGTPMDYIDGVPVADDIDGIPFDNDVDGTPMDDIDGVPVADDIDGVPMEEEQESSDEDLFA
mmetsp:Transcript_11659/g.19902  ORF Transcript_11659/g.19902 Transcript_11659/m.19902 type:complete len:605 (-) Transcript_11659:31-1845(-)